MNQGRGELGQEPLRNGGSDHQDNPEDVNNPRVPNNPENVDNQGVPPHVPIIQARLVRDVAVPLTANLASSIRKPLPGGKVELKRIWCKFSILMGNLLVSPVKILNPILGTS